MGAYLRPLVSCRIYYDSQADDCRNKDGMKPVVADKHSCYQL